ncbi:MAG: Lrp/AsnC family transcriptional regulator [Candidatus Nanoarchaeia archaeon]|nr:Lrp/AsnC family transcriptional regulator [Candidatus Nanoarchaeia archaeon]
MVKINHELIYLKSENARRSLKELSQHLKTTPQRLKYSISTLEKEKILKEPYCIVDYSHFGLILFRTYFKGGYIKEQDKAKIIDELKNNSFVTSIYDFTGEFDLGVEFTSPNPSKFNKEFKRIITLNPALNDYKIILNLVTYVYPRHYLTKNQNLHNLNIERLLGGDKELVDFNKNELNVLQNLLTDPTITLTKLAEVSKLNIKTVKSIIKDLTKRNVIKGFKHIIDTEKLNVHSSRLFLKLHNVSLERESQLMQFFLNTQEIVQVNKTIGDWDMEVDIESQDKSKIRSMIMKLREDFKDLIEKFNLIELYSYHKRSYLPQYLFNKTTQP